MDMLNNKIWHQLNIGGSETGKAQPLLHHPCFYNLSGETFPFSLLFPFTNQSTTKRYNPPGEQTTHTYIDDDVLTPIHAPTR